MESGKFYPAKNIFTGFINGMRINNNYTIQNINHYNYTGAKAQTFGSYHAMYPKTRMPASTEFYHDLPTLKRAVQALEEFFTEGATIFVYAGSNGEEAISIYSMLREPQKYEIYSIDPFKDAIEYANKGIFRIEYGGTFNDLYLISCIEPKNADEREAKKCFNKCLTREFKPIYAYVDALPDGEKESFYNASAFLRVGKVIQSEEYKNFIRTRHPAFVSALQQLNGEEFYKLNPEVQKQIHFVEGDIRDIANFQTNKDKPVGGIFFRNALFHLTNNDMENVGTPQGVDKKTNRREILKQLVTSVEQKLSPNGIFVMGSHPQEHFYLADNSASPNDICCLGGEYYYKTPINIDALRQNGHFTDIYTRNILDTIKNPLFKRATQMSLPFSPNIPLIWQKTS